MNHPKYGEGPGPHMSLGWTTERIGLLGGSFDPPTLGHVHVAEQLIEKGVVDKVLFVPSYVSYHNKSYVATPEQRIEMLKLVCDDSDYPLGICTYEIDNKMQTCTYDFVTKFTKWSEDVLEQYEVKIDEKFFFIVGMDNGKMIPKFKYGDKLMEEIPFIVVNRGEDKPVGGEWFDNEPHQVVDIGNKYEDCSSSVIREEMELFGAGMTLEKRFFDNLCSVSVFAYMVDNNLYMD